MTPGIIISINIKIYSNNIMVKLMSDIAVAEHCRNWRPVPLYLQEPILAVPNNIRQNPYTDLPNVSKNSYVAPQSVHVMAVNAQSLFGVDPGAFIKAYDKLINKEMATNPVELDIYYGLNELFREYEGFYRTEEAFSGAVGGGEIFQTLADADVEATITASEQNMARQDGTTLIKADAPKRIRGRYKKETAAMEAEDVNVAYSGGARVPFGEKPSGAEMKGSRVAAPPRTKEARRAAFMKSMNERYGEYHAQQAALAGEKALSRSMQTSVIPGLVTQTKVEAPSEGVEEVESYFAS
jgi:hypothetical protein